MNNNSLGLHLAAQNNRADILITLLSQKQDPNQKNEDENTPLHLAAQYGYGIIIKALLEHKANPNIANRYGFTPLHLAAYQNKAANKILLEQEMSFDKKDIPIPNLQETRTKFIYFEKPEAFIEATSLLLKYQANPNQTSSTGITPLHIAARNGNLDMIELLVANGADITLPYQGATPLHIAEELNHKGIAIYLRNIYKLRNLKYSLPEGQKWLLDRMENMNYMVETGVSAGLAYIGLEGFLKGKLEQLYPCLQALYAIQEDLLKKYAPAWTSDLFDKMVAYQYFRCPLKGEIHKDLGCSSYTYAELKEFFQCMEDSFLEKLKSTYLILNSLSEEVGILFKPREKKWTILSASTLNISNQVLSAEEIVPIIHKIFSYEEFSIFSTTMYCHAEDKEIFKAVTYYLTRHPKWKELHIISKEKARAKNKDNASILHLVSRTGNHELFQQVLQHTEDGDQQTKLLGSSPLHIAVDYKQTDYVKCLLKRQANPNLVQQLNPRYAKYPRSKEREEFSPYSATALSLACRRNDLNMTQMLLEYHADPNQILPASEAPLLNAARRGYTEIVKILLKYKANPNIYNNIGESPLYAAIDSKHEQIAKILLTNGANPDRADTRGATPLHIAVKNNSKELVKLLLAHNANTSLLNKEGFAPLHIAAINKATNIAATLLTKGADPDQATTAGATALHIAADYGCLDLVQLLVGANANLTVTVQEMTPLALAESKKHHPVVKYLRKAFIKKQQEIPLPLGQEWLLDRARSFGYRKPGICAGVSCVAAEMFMQGKFDLFQRYLHEIYSVEVESFVNHFARNTEFSHFVQKLKIYQDTFSEQIETSWKTRHTNEYICTGAYTGDELELFFSKIEQHIALKQDHYFNLMLTNLVHIITIGWDPYEKNWIIVDANHLPWCKQRMNAKELAAKVMLAFSFKGDILSLFENGHTPDRSDIGEEEGSVVIFKTEVCVLPENNPLLTGSIRSLYTDTLWKELHKISPQKVAAKDSSKTTWSHFAVSEEKDLEILKAILSNSNDMNEETPFTKSTPLISAITRKENALEVVKMLLAYGADPNQPSHWAFPLERAIYYNNFEISKLLLEHGASPNYKSKSNVTPPLCIAVKNKTPELINLLLKYEADPNLADEQSTTPLHIASQNEDIDSTKLLLICGATPNVQDNNGQTPLLQAAKGDTVEILQLLLEYKADPNQQNHIGETPLFPAIMQGNKDMIILLLKYKANPHHANKKGTTPLQIAIQEKLTGIVEILENPN